MESDVGSRRHVERKSVFTVKGLFRFICSAALFLSACTAEKGITVHDAWMRPTAQGENSAVYFVLQNDSREQEELIDVSSNLSDSVEMHESSMTEGTDVMRMDRVTSVALGADSEVTFTPGGLHVMLVGVKKELKSGDAVEILLHFRNHADIPVNVSVAEFAPDEHLH
jgi:copper(I)-binding protein